MSATDGRFGSDADMIQPLGAEDTDFVAPSTELTDLSNDTEITQVPPHTDLTERINETDMVSGDDRVVRTTTDDFVTSGEIAGEDVVDFGIASDASLGGLGVNIDDLPGDETPISREHVRDEIV
ncbi:MAG: hypothetical protein KY468_08800 [Armatimonadetes bacterium]|nr:hypothetical protein [Armatimonadota bacterium]